MAFTQPKVSTLVMNGPGKWDLMLALFDNKAGDGGRFVRFNLQEIRGKDRSERDVEICVNSVGREDGSGESWIVEGCIKGTGLHNRVRFYYDTRSRRGSVSKIETPD